MKNQPQDIYEKYIIKDNNYILVEDPKHSKESYHYVIWSINKNIKNILDIKEEIITDILFFLEKIKKMDLFQNEQMYFTFPPSHNCLHIHIVPKEYISYRKKEEIYSLEEISNNFVNIEKINRVNIQKKNAEYLDLKFNIGLIIINNIDKIKIIKELIKDNSLDYIVAIRKKHTNIFIEELIDNYKFINIHIYTCQLHLYTNIINYDFISSI